MVEQKTTAPMKIILAVDGSDHSRAAMHLLGDLPANPATKEKRQVIVLAVILPRNASDYAIQASLLEQTSLYLQEKGYQVSSELLTGYPAEMLLNYADQHRPDLFILGAKGLRSTLGILLGGVAQQVVEYSHWPVLVVRAPYTKIQKVLLLTDGSPYSQIAVEYMTRFPVMGRAELKVAHILPPIRPPEFVVQHFPAGSEVFVPLPTSELEKASVEQAEEEERQGKALLASTKAQLKKCGLEAGEVLLRGDAATEIIEYVKANEVDLIVAGSRGLGAVRGWLMGSVSRKLVHYSNCSVLIVKGGSDGKIE